MKKTLLVLAILALSPPASARPAIRITAAELATVAFPKAGVTLRPMGTAFGLAVSVPLSAHWGWNTEVGMKTGNTTFSPAPQIVLGPGIKLSPRTGLGLGLMYRYTPDYTKSDSHILSLGLAPSLAVTKEITLAFSIGGGVNRVGGEWVPEMGIAFKGSVLVW